MTEAKSARRRRRTNTGSLPREWADWFSGAPRPPNREMPWMVMAFPGWALLPERWAAWKAEHPDAVAPTSHAWLDDPDDPRQRVRPQVLVGARRCMGLK